MLTNWDNFLIFFNKNSSFLSFAYVDFSDFFLLVAWSTCLWLFLTKNTFRDKLIFFFLTLMFSAVWGFSASFDGLILMMLLTELAVMLFVLLLFMSNKFTHEQISISWYYFIIYMTLILLIYFVAVPLSTSKILILYNNVYLYCYEILTKDLSIIFLFVLLFNPIISVYLTLLLGLFSIFFICFFYQLRTFSQVFEKKKDNNMLVDLKRSQTFIRQVMFRGHIRTFQK